MAAGIPSTNQTVGFSREALQTKSKMGSPLELPGFFYSQYTPTAANLTSGTVTGSGASLIGALQLGLTTAGTAPLGGDAAVTFTSSSGLLVNFTTSSFLPTTLNYDQMPVKFSPSGTAVLPTGVLANTVYYYQWVSATTGRLALTPGGTVIAYTDAGSGTIYCQAATQYWGSPIIPAGFFQAADTLNQSTPSSVPSPGCMIRVEIEGHAKAASTDVLSIQPGLTSMAGTFTAVGGTTALAGVNAGPFPFKITTDMIIQQYGMGAITAPYNAQAMIRALCTLQVFSTVSTNTISTGLTTATWSKTTSIDVTAGLAVDVRASYATPAVAQYLEPLFVRMWAYN